MDLDATILWLATRSPESLDTVKGIGLTEDLLKGAAVEAFGFVDQYRRAHGVIPPAGLIAEVCGIVLRPVEDGVAAEFVLDRLHERATFQALKSGLKESYEALDSGNLEEAVAAVYALNDELRNRQTKRVRARPLSDLVGEVKDLYERTKRGESGILFPWPLMNQMTMGMWPGTLTFFTARPAVGKSWACVLVCWGAWQAGHRVLVISPEMSRVELAERVVARHGQLNYSDLISGRLGGLGGEQALDKTVAELQAAENFYVLDDEDRMEPKYVEEAIQAVKPDLVGFDSVYMMRAADGTLKGGKRGGSGVTRYDRILQTIDWLRGLSRRTGIPYLCVSQLSRDAKKTTKGQDLAIKKGLGSGGLEDAVAMTDTLLMDAHNVFAMWQDTDMRDDKQMLFVPLKVRRSALRTSVVTNWDLDAMDFSQIGDRVERRNDGFVDDEVF